jgi:hypothetical protein
VSSRLITAPVEAPLRSTEILTGDGVLNVITGAVRALSPDEPQPCHAGVDPDNPWCYRLGYVRPEVAMWAERLAAVAQFERSIAGGAS